jgi:hypothetical protein
MRDAAEKTLACTLVMSCVFWAAPAGQGYTFNEIVPDVRQPVAVSGGSACPVRSHRLIAAGSIAVRWSTALGTNPVTIITQNQTASERLNEIEQVINTALGVWTGVNGTTLAPASLAPLTRVSNANSCGSDGVNSICFDQPDMAFTPGVLAFTRVVTADQIGVQLGSGPPATQLGQILDADIYFNPGDSRVMFATPAALPSAQTAYDLESVLTHELGHSLGFSHSAVWSAVMYPFAPTPGTIIGTRPTVQQPDAPLGEDDRTGLRVPGPRGHRAHGIDPGTNIAGEFAFASRFPARRDGDIWRACGGRGCRERRSNWRNPRRMELRGSRTGTIRWQL